MLKAKIKINADLAVFLFGSQKLFFMLFSRNLFYFFYSSRYQSASGMGKIKLSFGFVMVLFLVCCSSKNELDTAQSRLAVIGTWYWQQSSGGISGNELITPESTGIVIKLVFGANKKVTVFTNDMETGNYPYTIKTGKSIFDNQEHYLLNFNEMNYVIRYIDKSEMSIQDNFADGYILTYVR